MERRDMREAFTDGYRAAIDEMRVIERRGAGVEAVLNALVARMQRTEEHAKRAADVWVEAR